MAGSGQAFPMSTQGSVTGPLMSGQGVISSLSACLYPVSTVTDVQHQQAFPGPAPASAPTQPQMASPTKSVNRVLFCRHGQETNRELVNKLLDVFRQFKAMQQLTQKNRQIKEVIDKIRTIMWEVNTMIVMRKT